MNDTKSTPVFRKVDRIIRSTGSNRSSVRLGGFSPFVQQWSVCVLRPVESFVNPWKLEGKWKAFHSILPLVSGRFPTGLKDTCTGYIDIPCAVRVFATLVQTLDLGSRRYASEEWHGSAARRVFCSGRRARVQTPETKCHRIKITPDASRLELYLPFWTIIQTTGYLV